MQLEALIPILTALLGAVSGVALMRSRVKAERAALTFAQYRDASSLIEKYVEDLQELANKLEELHRQLADAKIEQHRLRVENEKLRNGNRNETTSD
jgi:hypothetical protein